MAPGKDQEKLRLRPHHILCNQFLPLDNLNRGQEFDLVLERMRALTRSESDLIVIVTEGPDQVCDACPDYRDGRCESKNGDEEAVRKWDSKIVRGLGISFGAEMTVSALLALIREKAPLDFCESRCPWKAFCQVGGQGRDSG